MRLDPSSTVASIVAEHPASARVFQQHRVDFCCRGHVTFAAACASQPDGGAELQRAVEHALVSPGGAPAAAALTALPTPALIGRILERHHPFLRRALPQLEPLAVKVAAVHGDHNPKLREVRDTFLALRRAIEPHLQREEQVLFPALLAAGPDAAVIRAELAAMLRDHLEVGAALGELREAAAGFTTPEWGCGSYRLLMSGLEELETDTLAHVHLENHVLMPRFAAGQP